MAARPIWKGAISFGLVNVPITLFGLEKKVDLQFKLLDGRTKSTIRYERVNEVTGEEVPWDKIVKGYEYTKNNFVILEDEDFEKVAREASKTIEVIDFVGKSEISDLYFDKPYILSPQKKAEKGYVLLREVLTKLNRIGIARVVIRTREYLSAVVPQGNALILVLLRYSQELRSMDEFQIPSSDPKEYKVTDRELQLAEQLVDSQTTKWEPEKYKDEYREELLKWIAEKAEKGELASIEEADEEGHEVATNVIDLVDLLRKSVLASTEKTVAGNVPASKPIVGKPATGKTATSSKPKAKPKGAKSA